MSNHVREGKVMIHPWNAVDQIKRTTGINDNDLGSN